MSAIHERNLTIGIWLLTGALCIMVALITMFLYFRWQDCRAALPTKIIFEGQKVYIRSTARREDLQYEWFTKASAYKMPPEHKYFETMTFRISKIGR